MSRSRRHWQRRGDDGELDGRLNWQRPKKPAFEEWELREEWDDADELIEEWDNEPELYRRGYDN